MAEVFVDVSAIEKVVTNCKCSIEEMTTMSNDLKQKKQIVLQEWRDQKSKEFDNLISSCIHELDKAKKELQKALESLKKLYSIVLQYENISFEKKQSVFSETRTRLENFALDIEKHVDNYNRMGESYFLTEEGRVVSHGISKAVFTVFCNLINVPGVFLDAASESFSSLCEMVFPNVLNTIQGTANNLHAQYNDPYTLINQLFPFENENGVRISSIEINNVNKLNAAFESDGLDVQMVDITGLNFSETEVDVNSEEQVKEIYEMLNEYRNGASIELCFSRFPEVANIVFGEQRIEAHLYRSNSLIIDTNRQIVATALNMGAHFLPIVVRDNHE